MIDSNLRYRYIFLFFIIKIHFLVAQIYSTNDIPDFFVSLIEKKKLFLYNSFRLYLV